MKKTTRHLARSRLWCSRKKHFLTLLLIICALPGASTALAQSPGTVVAWGGNSSEQTTVPVAAQSGVTAIAAGWNQTVALKSDGSVVAWGYNGFGQTTVPVAAQSGVTALAAGFGHTVALKNDGSVVAWGSTDPVPAGLSGVTAIAAGNFYTVALVSPTALQFAAADYSVTENGGAVSLTVQRLGDLSGIHTVDYATQNGSAAAGVDFIARSGTLTFAPGQTIQTVSIPILNDGVPESTDSFQVLLSNRTGFQAGLGRAGDEHGHDPRQRHGHSVQHVTFFGVGDRGRSGDHRAAGRRSERPRHSGLRHQCRNGHGGSGLFLTERHPPFRGRRNYSNHPHSDCRRSLGRRL